MNQTPLNGLGILIARLVVAGVFVLAALPKIQNPVDFTSSVQGFRVTGAELSAWVAIVLPWLELVTGVGLLIPQIRRTSGGLIALLLLLFIGLHTSAWVRGLDINCGCFGTESEASHDYHWLIARNVLLLLAVALVLLRDFRFPPPKTHVS